MSSTEGHVNQCFCSVFLYFLLLIICCHTCYLGRRAPEPHFCCKCWSLTHARSLYYISMYSCISEMSCFCWIVDVAALWRQCHSSLHELHYWWICCTKNLWINLTDCKISTSCIWPINLVDYIHFKMSLFKGNHFFGNVYSAFFIKET